MKFKRQYTIGIVLIVAIIAAIGSPVASQRWNESRRVQFARLCQLARNGQRWEELRTLADDWTRWDPQNGEAWMNRGLAATARGAWSEAAADFWHVRETSPQVIPAMIEVSKLAFTHLNEPLKGVEACERILKTDPLAAGARQQLIWFYAMTLQRAKLKEQILQAIQRRREPREAYVYYFLLYTLRSQDAVDLNTRWLQGSPDSELFLVASVINLKDPQSGSPETPMASSPTHQQDALPEKTKLELVDELLIRFPHNLELIAYKAEERLANGDFSGAATVLANSPESAALDARFWRFKGWLHEANNDTEASIAAYRKALELHPVDWNTMNRLAIVERRVRNHSEVKRLTGLVERGNDIRKRLRQQRAVEVASAKILQELASFFGDCGEREVAIQLEARLTGASIPPK